MTTFHRTMIGALMVVVGVGLPGKLMAQDTGMRPDEPFVFFTPGLAIMDRRTDHDQFFNSVDTTLVVPFSPHASVLGTLSIQFEDKLRWTVAGNYDWFLDPKTTLRLAGGLFDDEFGARATAFQQQRRFGTGIRFGMVGGDLEVGGFISVPLAWGFSLRHEPFKQRIRGRDRVTDLGAATALTLSLRGSSPHFGTEPEYFYPRDAEWRRFGQGAQAQSTTAAGLPTRLHQVWVSSTGGPVRSSCAIIESTVYVGSDDGYLYALDLSTGALRWRYRLGSPVASSPSVANGRVFVGTDGGAVYCLQAEADKRLAGDQIGRQLWRIVTGGPVLSSPLITVAGLAIFGSGDGSVYAVRAATGERAWVHRTGGAIIGSPVKTERPVPIILDKGRRTEDIIFCGSTDGFIHALIERTGALLWKTDTGAPVQTTPVVSAEKLMVANEDGRVMALQVSDGREVWRTELSEKPGGSPVIQRTNVVVPLAMGRLVGLRIATGEVAWTAQVPGRIESTPMSTQGETLYVGSTDGHLYALDGGTGKILWDFGVGGGLTASPAAAHGMLVCGSQDGSVYAFSGKPPRGGVVTNRVAPETRLAATKVVPGDLMGKPQPVPDLTPIKRTWTSPPAWAIKPEITKPAESGAAPMPKPPAEPLSDTGTQPVKIRMRLSSEPADAAELPIDLTNQRDTYVTWGTTDPVAEVDGQIVHNDGGQIRVAKTFDADGTYPVMMVTDKGTPAERVFCRLVVVDTSDEPTSLREVAFSPDGDGRGDTIVFRVSAEAPADVVAVRIVDIRDLQGNAVRTWSAPGAGETSFIWDGTDLAGNPVPAGVYQVIYTVKDKVGTLRRMKQRVLLERGPEKMPRG